MCGRFVVAASAIVLLPAVLLGAAFPAVLRLIVDRDHVGGGVGAAFAFNTAGGIAGSALTGFVLVPALGLVHALAALAIAAALIGFAALTRGPIGLGMDGRRPARIGILAIAAAAILMSVLTPRDQLARLLAAARGGRIVFYEESRGGTVAVVEQSADGQPFHRLYIQGVSNSGDAMPSIRYMRLQALLPLIVHDGDPRSALVIGYGTGITAGALTRFPGLDHAVVAELLPAVARASSAFEGNYEDEAKGAIEIRYRDGRRELQGSAERYDLITLEPPPPSAAGVVNLYSSDFYRLAGARLQDHGIVAQWLPLATQNEDDTRALVRSFIDVFPYASLWTTELHETLLVGSFRPMPLDLPRIAQRLAEPPVAAALRAVGIDSPAALLATWMTDRDGLLRFAGAARPVTDDRPRIEHALWVRPDAFGRNFVALFALRSDVPIVGGDAAFRASLAAECSRLDVFYRAGLSAYAGNREQWASDMRAVMQADGRNPYYRWFSGMP
jgi:spermidine synthase